MLAIIESIRHQHSTQAHHMVLAANAGSEQFSGGLAIDPWLPEPVLAKAEYTGAQHNTFVH